MDDVDNADNVSIVTNVSQLILERAGLLLCNNPSCVNLQGGSEVGGD